MDKTLFKAQKIAVKQVGPKSRTLPICIVLAVVVACAFWQVARCDFINFDDHVYVTENSHVLNGLTIDGLRWAFTVGYAGNWHPLTWMSHMLDVQLFGLNPAWHHLTNLLFHIANTILLFLVLFRMTKGLWQSAFVAALFGIHPVHVESVAWVAERKDVLSTFFWFLTMGAYIRYVEHPLYKRYLVLIACFAVGLTSKPMLVTLPFALLLLDYWPLRRFEQKAPVRNMPGEETKKTKEKKRKGESRARQPVEQLAEGQASYSFRPASIGPLLKEKIPLFGLAALSCLLTYAAQQKEGAVISTDALPLSGRVAHAFVSYAVYIGKMFWPGDLAVFYPYPSSWPQWQTVSAVLLFASVTAVVILCGRKYGYLRMGWLWYAGTLVPVIGFVQVGRQASADRYTYIPLIGLFIIIAWGIPDLLKRWRYRRQALAASSIVALSCLFAATWLQVGYWQDSITLYDHSLAVTSGSSIVLNNRGNAHSLRFEYKRAMADFDKAIEMAPKDAETYNNRGALYNALDDYTRAIADLDRAIEIDPHHKKAYYNRGVAYAKGPGDYKKAIADFDMALTLKPPIATEIYRSRGATWGAMGDYAHAIADFNKAIEANPGNAQAYFNRGMAYRRIGNNALAMDDLKEAARLGSEPANNVLRNQAAGR